MPENEMSHSKQVRKTACDCFDTLSRDNGGLPARINGHVRRGVRSASWSWQTLVQKCRI